MPTQRWASTRAVLTGLPASAAIVAVSSSSRSATRCAARSSTAARSCWGKSPASKAFWAALAARSTSAASPFGTRPTDGAVVGALDLGPLAGLDPLAGDEELVVGRLNGLRGHDYPEPRGQGKADLEGQEAQLRRRLVRSVQERCQRLRTSGPSLAACACAAAARLPGRRARRRAPRASWVIKGAGFGHGIGMSQYGAYGSAKQGIDLRRDPRATTTRGRRSARRRRRPSGCCCAAYQPSVRFSGALRGLRRLPRRGQHLHREAQGARRCCSAAREAAGSPTAARC